MRFLRSFASARHLSSESDETWSKAQRLEHLNNVVDTPFLERKMLPVCTIETSESPEWTNERASEGTVYLRNLNMTGSSSNLNETHSCRCYIYTYICKRRIRHWNSQRKLVIHNYISKIMKALPLGISGRS